MADGSFPGLVSRSRDLNSTSNVIWTNLADDAGNAVTITGNKLDVNASVTIETAFVDDSAFTIGTDKVNAQGYLADETATDSVDEGDIGLARMTLDRKVITSSEQSGTWDIGTVTTLTGITNDVNIADGGNSITVDDGGASLTVDGTVAATQSGVWDIGTVTTLTGITNDVNIADGGNSITVDAVDLDIRDLALATDAVQVSGNATANGETNPIFVKNVDTVISGEEVHDYDTAAAVASDTADNHDYTVAGTTFLLTSVIVSGSGNVKFEIQTGPLASLATVAVGFLTGRQGDTKQINFSPAIEVPSASTGTVRIIRTNRQGSATDLYSTIIGNDV